MTGLAVGIVGLKIADAAVFNLELSLKKDVGSHRRVGIVVGIRVLVAKQNLDILVVKVADGDIAGVKLHLETQG